MIAGLSKLRGVVEIVESVIADYTGQGMLVPAWRWDLADPAVYRKRSLTTQFEESDFALLERLLAEEGLHYHLEHAGDAASVRFHRSVATERADGIQHWSTARRWQTTRLQRASWDYRSLGLRPAEASGEATATLPPKTSIPPARTPGPTAPPANGSPGARHRRADRNIQGGSRTGWSAATSGNSNRARATAISTSRWKSCRTRSRVEMDYAARNFWKFRYQTDRPLTEEERAHRYKQERTRDAAPMDFLSVIKLNSSYIELVDRWYPIIGFQTWLGGAALLFALAVEAAVVWAFFYAPISSATERWAFLAILTPMAAVLAAVGVFAIRVEAFRWTHYPMRLNRKTRQVHVFRQDGTVLPVPWDELFITLGTAQAPLTGTTCACA